MVAAGVALMGARAGLKASKQYSVSVLGYDFIGLISRITLFIGIAFLINAYFVASIKGNIWLNGVAAVFGVRFPQTLPQWLVSLFTDGIGSPRVTPITSTPTAAGKYNPPFWDDKFKVGGEFEGMEYFDYGTIEHREATGTETQVIRDAGFTITFWQIIQIISILLIVFEYFQYDRKLEEDGKTANATTKAVFALLGIGMSLITFPQMITKFKEMRILQQ